ncbi:MAG TPA: 8-amino-7-oxononanoate synthase, partial [Buchnera sp. (in: enterobacteria)]|nr:8-amino-7-oxononanoate synthase [Buchnera sp. (in: enterobacteria)]
MIWKKRINMELRSILIKQTFRKRIVIEKKNNQFIKIKNKNYCNFSSNDYLGLSQDIRVINAWKKG